MPTKEKLFGVLKDKDLMILAVSFQEPEDLVRDFQQEFKLSFPVLFDSEGQVAEKYEFRGHPVTFIVDRQGMLAGKIIGERDWSSKEAKMMVEDLLRPVPEAAREDP